MKTRKMKFAWLAVLVLGMVASFGMGQKTSRVKLKPKTDSIFHYHTSGEQGKWVYGCPDCGADSCNAGVGNVGPKCTHHWVED